jgi:hypothetical protein
MCKLLAVLAVLAYIVCIQDSASAATWMVNGTSVTSESSPEVQALEIGKVPETEEKYLSLTFLLFGVKIENRCTGLNLVGAELEPKGEISTGARAEFSGCKLYIEEIYDPECKPHTAGRPNGVVVTYELQGGIFEGALNLIPAVGNVLKVYNLGSSCVIGEEIVVEGGLSLKDANGKIETEEATHVVEGDGTSISLFGEPAMLTGRVTLGLSGKEKWSASP